MGVHPSQNRRLRLMVADEPWWHLSSTLPAVSEEMPAASGENARRQFGDEVVDHFARFAASDAQRHMVSRDFLPASFSAAYALRLGRRRWSEADQQRMTDALGRSILRWLESNRDA